MFQVDDKVKCVDADNTALNFGDIYTVTYVDKYCVDIMDQFFYIYNTLDQTRFELVKKEPIFKIGDKVKCIDAQHTSVVRLGEIYTVFSVVDNGEYINISHDVGGGMRVSRFELVKEEPMDTVDQLVKQAWDEYADGDRHPSIVAIFKKYITLATQLEPVKEWSVYNNGQYLNADGQWFYGPFYFATNTEALTILWNFWKIKPNDFIQVNQRVT